MPILAVFIEPLSGLFILFIALNSFIRYKSKKNVITRQLTITLFLLAFAALISGLGKYLAFNSKISREQISYTDFTIVLAYCLLTLSNISFTPILKELFLEKESQIPLILIIIDSIIIGLLIGNISFAFGVYNKILYYLILFIFVTTLTHGYFAILAFREIKSIDDRLSKIGFRLISLFSLLIILVLVLFVLDLAFGIIFVSSYTIFYYMAWITVGIASAVGYLGYIMPNWFKSIIT